MKCTRLLCIRNMRIRPIRVLQMLRTLQIKNKVKVYVVAEKE
jgi:hypothetical protein